MMNATATVCIRRLFGPLVVALSLFCLALVASPTTALSQEIDECSGGTLFYIAYPDTIGNTYDARYPHQLLRSKTFILMVYSPVTQELKVGRANGAGTRYPINAGQMIEIDAEEVGLPLVTIINTPQTNVLKLEAEYPVVVYCYMGTAFGAEAFTAIPTESWGQEYYAATWPGEIVRDVFPSGEFNYRTEPKEGQAEILVIAAYDNTQVTLQGTAAFRECSGCNSVRLNEGEAYLVQSIVDLDPSADSQDDIAGTKIIANKRIAVISGNPRVMHNSGVRPSLGENAFKNMAIEWLPPVEQHGTEFVFLPTWDDRRQRRRKSPRSGSLQRDCREREARVSDELYRSNGAYRGADSRNHPPNRNRCCRRVQERRSGVLRSTCAIAADMGRQRVGDSQTRSGTKRSDDFFFDQSYRHLIGSARDGKSGVVIDIDAGKPVKRIGLPGLPHLGSGITWTYKDRQVMATPHLKEGKVSVINLNDWSIEKTIDTKGPGFFMRSHEKSKYAWTDVFFGPNRDVMHVIDKRTLEIVKTLKPAPGKTAAHVEFDRYGKHAIVSIWEKDGAIVIYDAATLEEVKRIPMSKPSGKYNVWNKITFSEGTSH